MLTKYLKGSFFITFYDIIITYTRSSMWLLLRYCEFLFCLQQWQYHLSLLCLYLSSVCLFVFVLCSFIRLRSLFVCLSPEEPPPESKEGKEEEGICVWISIGIGIGIGFGSSFNQVRDDDQSHQKNQKQKLHFV